MGTIFERKIDKDNENDYYKNRHLIAMCGDRNDPCPLNIDINLGNIENIYDSVKISENQIISHKNEIIINKNNLLFGYDTSENVIEIFNDIKETLETSMKIYEFYFKELMNIIDNSSKKEELKRLLIDFYSDINNFKKTINEFDRTEDTQYVIDALVEYKTKIIPKLNKIMKNKYAYVGVDYNENFNTYHLIQEAHTIEQLETNMATKEPEVVSLKIGMNVIKETRVKKNIREEAIPNIRKKKAKIIVEPSSSSIPSSSSSTPSSSSSLSSSAPSSSSSLSSSAPSSSSSSSSSASSSSSSSSSSEPSSSSSSEEEDEEEGEIIKN